MFRCIYMATIYHLSSPCPGCLTAACVKFFQKLQDVRKKEMSEDFSMEEERSAHHVILCNVFLLLLFFLLALSMWLPFHCLDFSLSAKLQNCFVDGKTSPEPPRADAAVAAYG